MKNPKTSPQGKMLAAVSNYDICVQPSHRNLNGCDYLDTTPARLAAVLKLMKSNSNAIGFLPRLAVEQAVSENLLYHQIDNGCWVGYLIAGVIRQNRAVVIKQECIDKAARRYGSGLRLLDKLIIDCRSFAVPHVTLRCAGDLESNMFWTAAGFRAVDIDFPNNARRRPIVIYRYDLTHTASRILAV